MLLLPCLLLLLSFLPCGYAGPACTRKYYKSSQCIQKCRSRWGYPGSMMGSNPWGVVMQSLDDDSKDTWNAVIAEACGMPSTKSKSKEIEQDDDDPGNAGAVGNDPLVEESSVEEDDVASTVMFGTTQPSSSASSSIAKAAASTASSPPQRTTAAPKTTSTPKKPSPSPTTQKAAPPKTTQPSSNQPPADQGGDIGQYLKSHNDFRRKHGAAPLTWSDNLARKAQEWSNKCRFVHSGGSLGPFGENLAAGSGGSYGIASAIKSWTDEAQTYNPNNPKASHFTQVVWKDSKRVGCGFKLCDGIFDPKFGRAKYFVCEYDPPGNFNNDFQRNVQV